MKNAQLWKRVLHEGVRVDVPGEAGDWFENRVVCSPIILASEQWEDTDAYRYDWSRFTNLSIPFNGSFWIETSATDGDGLVGALVTPVRRTTGDWWVRVMGCGASAVAQPACGVSCAFRITENGELDGARDGVLRMFFSYAAGYDGDKKNAIAGGYVDFVLGVLMALGCTNVCLSHRDNDAKQTRIATKRHGPTAHGYRYHVLVVKPMGARSAGDSEAQEIGNMPRHVCRGHFKDYGPKYGKKKLFGKYEGRFYIPPHMKGNAKNGTVYKDYEVAAV